jgi:hypothetical protein
MRYNAHAHYYGHNIALWRISLQWQTTTQLKPIAKHLHPPIHKPTLIILRPSQLLVWVLSGTHWRRARGCDDPYPLLMVCLAVPHVQCVAMLQCARSCYIMSSRLHQGFNRGTIHTKMLRLDSIHPRNDTKGVRNEGNAYTINYCLQIFYTLSGYPEPVQQHPHCFS